MVLGTEHFLDISLKIMGRPEAEWEGRKLVMMTDDVRRLAMGVRNEPWPMPMGPGITQIVWYRNVKVAGVVETDVCKKGSSRHVSCGSMGADGSDGQIKRSQESIISS